MPLYGLIGNRLSHSFSEGYFAEKFRKEGIEDARYKNFPIKSIDELPGLINQNPQLSGLNVTIPYKEAVIPYLNEMDPDARAIGAVNTIRIERNQSADDAFYHKNDADLRKTDHDIKERNGKKTADMNEKNIVDMDWKKTIEMNGKKAIDCDWKSTHDMKCNKTGPEQKDFFLTGHNTDLYGFETSLTPLLKPFHQNALVLGTGGASKAVIYALERMGVEYMLVSRNPSGKQVMAYEQINEEVMKNHQIIVNTSPLGMYPEVDKCPDLPYEYLSEYHILYDLIYNPAETLFLKKGKSKGSLIKNGLEMLELQAEKSWEIWNRE